MLRVFASALHSPGPPSGLCALANINCFITVLFCVSWCRFHLGMTGSLAVKVCMTASFHSWQSLALPSCSVGKLQLLWHPQGVPRVQYVNAKAADDEWPPKYWKVTAYR